MPLAADYTRFSRDRRSAFFGVGLGYLVPTLWLFPMGALLLLSRDLSDPATLPATVAAGGLASVLALLALTVDETDEAFANVYSTAVSLQNLFPRVSQRLLIVARHRGRHHGRARDRPPRVPAVPVPARLVLRAALRRPACRLADLGAALQPRRRLRRADGAAGRDRRVARRLLAVPVDPAGRPRLVDVARRPRPSRRAAARAPRCRPSPPRSR